MVNSFENAPASRIGSCKVLWRLCAWVFLSLVVLQGVHWFFRQEFSFQNLLSHLGFILGVFGLAWVLERLFSRNPLIDQSGGALILGVSAAIYLQSRSTPGAWLLLISGWAVLIWLEARLSGNSSAWRRAAFKLLIAGIAGAAVIAVLQIEERFSEEEFFAAIQLGVMSFNWLVISLAYRQWSQAEGSPAMKGNASRTWLVLSLVGFCVLGSFYTLSAYQNSFFPQEAPTFEGISNASPFICGRTAAEANVYQGREVFKRLVDLIESSPQKTVPEFGVLALAKNDAAWAGRFHDELLNEASQMLFTQRENSVKYGQCLAAQRVYYYWLVSQSNPSLFNTEEKKIISEWFSAVNRRALSIGWVDWFYATAFSHWPSGPYENQECGAGLLAILEVSGLGDPALAVQNREYLAKNPRGWLERFRNTDDTYNYQVEWLRNAWYQYLYWHQADPVNVQLSFEWFLLQALPDGSPLRYNHYAASSAAEMGYWAGNLSSEAAGGQSQAASILGQDFGEAAMWLSGRAIDYMEAQGQHPGAQPGLERPTEMLGRSRGWGSCLMFGNSGLPNRAGPLAPDKIVFRNGWQDDSLYLLLNLRFTGWHRYKATNSIVLIYQNKPIASEIHLGKPFSWLPVGRSLLRDKRNPRENLNSLLVRRTGLSAAVHALTGIGSPWAQDPPFYAEVERFETGPEMDQSRTMISGWRGWQQGRGILFDHRGPVVIVDQVKGPDNGRAAISWHFMGPLTQRANGRYQLGEGRGSTEVLFIRYDGRLAQDELHEAWLDESGYTELIYAPKQRGSFSLLTVLLPPGWAGSQASFLKDPTGAVLRLEKDGSQIDFKLAGYLDGSE